MDPLSSAQAILQRPQKVVTAGSRRLEERPLGQRFRRLVQTGLLSAILLTQALQGVSAGNLMFQGAEAPDSKPVAAMVQAQAVNSSGMELINPLEHQSLAGVNLPNGINGMEVVQQWREGEVEPAQLLQLTEVLVMTQSPVIVRSQADKDQVLALAQRTQGLFQVRDQTQAEAFLAKHSITQLEQDGLLIAGSELTNSQVYLDPQVEDTFQFWESFSTLRKGGTAADTWVDEAQTPAQFDQAVQSLKDAVATTGLNSLKVPLPMWTSSKHLTTVADQIRSADKELQAVTGWDGGVLGLKGNVNLTVGIPYDVALSGMGADGKVHLQTPTDIMGHEWLHGVDYMLAKHVGYQPSDRVALLTEAVHDHGSHAHGTLAQSWSALEKGVDVHMEAWQQRMAGHVKSDSQNYLESASYLTSSREKLAYTFDAMLASKLGTDAVLVRNGDTGKYSPTREEAAQTQVVWTQTFQALEGTWWNALPDAKPVAPAVVTAAIEAPVPAPAATVEVSMPSLKSWRQARAEPEVEAPSVTRVAAFGR
jgi:hypothetical protein